MIEEKEKTYGLRDLRAMSSVLRTEELTITGQDVILSFLKQEHMPGQLAERRRNGRTWGGRKWELQRPQLMLTFLY